MEAVDREEWKKEIEVMEQAEWQWKKGRVHFMWVNATCHVILAILTVVIYSLISCRFSI